MHENALNGAKDKKQSRNSVIVGAYAQFFDGLQVTFLYPFLPFFVMRLGARGASEVSLYVGAIVSAYYVGQAITGTSWGKASEKSLRRTIQLLIVSFVFSSIWVILFGFSTNLIMAVASRFFMGLLNGGAPVSKKYVVHTVVPSKVVKAFSIVMITYVIGTLLGPLIGGFLYDPARNYSLFMGLPLIATYPILFPCVIVATFGMFGILMTLSFHSERVIELEIPAFVEVSTSVSSSTSDTLSEQKKKIIEEGSLVSLNVESVVGKGDSVADAIDVKRKSDAAKTIDDAQSVVDGDDDIRDENDGHARRRDATMFDENDGSIPRIPRVISTERFSQYSSHVSLVGSIGDEFSTASLSRPSVREERYVMEEFDDMNDEDGMRDENEDDERVKDGMKDRDKRKNGAHEEGLVSSISMRNIQGAATLQYVEDDDGSDRIVSLDVKKWEEMLQFDDDDDDDDDDGDGDDDDVAISVIGDNDGIAGARINGGTIGGRDKRRKTNIVLSSGMRGKSRGSKAKTTSGDQCVGRKEKKGEEGERKKNSDDDGDGNGKDEEKVFTRTIILAIIAFGMVALLHISFDTVIPLIVSMDEKDGGLSFTPGEIAIAQSISAIVTIIFQSFFYMPIVRHIGVINTSRMGMTLLIPLFALFPFIVYTSGKDVLMWMGIGFFMSLRAITRVFFYPSFNAVVGQAPAPQYRGRIGGVVHSTSAVLQAVGPLGGCTFLSLVLCIDTQILIKLAILFSFFVAAAIVGTICTSKMPKDYAYHGEGEGDHAGTSTADGDDDEIMDGPKKVCLHDGGLSPDEILDRAILEMSVDGDDQVDDGKKIDIPLKPIECEEVGKNADDITPDTAQDA
eukprot:TRINITY_DN1106_c0_g3_i1.p1 TRINITY_DN1106_c0_g3~~TRINITY_DN1106_c0_g3_i1.p1  ORF type:complete len:849 (+),score=308.82 TRINITY_DN1106_c0_g3_i1:163-2709(+)